MYHLPSRATQITSNDDNLIFCINIGSLLNFTKILKILVPFISSLPKAQFQILPLLGTSVSYSHPFGKNFIITSIPPQKTIMNFGFHKKKKKTLLKYLKKKTLLQTGLRKEWNKGLSNIYQLFPLFHYYVKIYISRSKSHKIALPDLPETMLNALPSTCPL